MRVDFKVTAWESVTVQDEHKEEVLEKLRSGDIQTANDLIEFLDSQDSYNDYEILTETVDQLTPQQNNGFSTIEAVEDKFVSERISLWGNGKDCFSEV